MPHEKSGEISVLKRIYGFNQWRC